MDVDVQIRNVIAERDSLTVVRSEAATGITKTDRCLTASSLSSWRDSLSTAKVEVEGFEQ